MFAASADLRLVQLFRKFPNAFKHNANSKHLSLYYLQQMNIHRKLFKAKKTITIDADKNDETDETEEEDGKNIEE